MEKTTQKKKKLPKIFFADSGQQSTHINTKNYKNTISLL